VWISHGLCAMITSILCVIRRNDMFERVATVESVEATIGRCNSCEIWLPSEVVSRKHAVLRMMADGASIRDLGSRNKTLIKGRCIDGEVKLNEGDEIRIGPFTLVICFTISTVLAHSVNVTDSTHTDPNPVATFRGTAHSTLTAALTPAQRRVFDGFLEGLSEKEIAVRLGISIHTVHSHAKAIYKSFEISSRAELLRHTAEHERQYRERL